MLTILSARAGQNTRDEMLERMRQSQAARKLFLVPEPYSHETERALCQVLGNAGARNCEVLSFSRLSSRVEDSCGGGAVPTLDAGGRMMLLYRALRQTRYQLTTGLSTSRKPAYLNSLMATMDECRQYSVTPEQLILAGESTEGPQGEKLRDIGVVYGAYEALTSQGKADPMERLDRVAELLEGSGWASDCEIWIWGFSRFTPQERAVIRAMLPQAPMTVSLTFDPEDDSDVFEPGRKEAACLKRLAESLGVPVRRQNLDRPIPRRDSLVFLERNLFRNEGKTWEGACDVVRLTAKTPRQELEMAASEILRLVREEHLRYRDLAVCARNFSSYEGLAESVFSQFGIPLFFSVMTDVLQKPVLALVTSALEASANDYPYEEMFRYLKTGLAGLTEEECDLLENYVLTWNIKGGTWYRQKPWDMHPQGYGRSFSEEDTAVVERLDEIRRRVIRPLESLRNDPDRTGRGRALTLYRMLEEIDLPVRLEERADALGKQGNLRSAAEYRMLWDILVSVLEQCAVLLDDLDLDLSEFSQLFSLALSQYDVGTIPVSLDRVTAGNLPRMAGRRFQVLFLLGADSASIPSCDPKPGLFTDLDRVALLRWDLELAPQQEDLLQQEMTYAYEVCAVPSHRLYVSYAAEDGGGAERSPSFLYQSIAGMFPDAGELFPEESCRLAAPGAALDLAGKREEVALALSSLEEYGSRVQRVCQAGQWRRKDLSPQGVTALYHGMVPMSATRMDLFNSCHFSHFLRYGLDAKPRERAAFRPSDYGTFIHAVLEDVLRHAMERPGGIAELAGNSEACRELAEQAADRYEREELAGLEDETARFRYTFLRMKRSAELVAESVCRELSVSDFAPAWFELGFGRGQTLPPLEVDRGIRLRLTGFVDRVDIWKQNGACYLRVVDYKTGKKTFDFSDVADGRGLQMLLYLFALRQSGNRLFGPEEVIPAGVMYVPARNPVVNGKREMTEEEIEQSRQKELKRKGLILGEDRVLEAMEHTENGEYRYLPVQGKGRKEEFLADLEQMDRLDHYLNQVLEDMAVELSEGRIDANPYWHNSRINSCQYCPYAQACHFEECCGDRKRLRRALSAREFWEILEKKEGPGHGN